MNPSTFATLEEAHARICELEVRLYDREPMAGDGDSYLERKLREVSEAREVAQAKATSEEIKRAGLLATVSMLGSQCDQRLLEARCYRQRIDLSVAASALALGEINAYAFVVEQLRDLLKAHP